MPDPQPNRPPRLLPGTCDLCGAALPDEPETCARCGIAQPGSRTATAMARAEARRRHLNTLIVAAFFIAAVWLFANVDDPVERAWNRLCATSPSANCD